MVAAKLPKTNPMVVEESTTQNGPEEDRYIHAVHKCRVRWN